jgi:hypothetical protein
VNVEIAGNGELEEVSARYRMSNWTFHRTFYTKYTITYFLIFCMSTPKHFWLSARQLWMVRPTWLLPCPVDPTWCSFKQLSVAQPIHQNWNSTSPVDPIKRCNILSQASFSRSDLIFFWTGVQCTIYLPNLHIPGWLNQTLLCAFGLGKFFSIQLDGHPFPNPFTEFQLPACSYQLWKVVWWLSYFGI